MTDAILEITDGTTTISLINPSSGFHMISWTPGITDYKGGGVFTNPPLADWRQLRVGKWDTVQEQFGLTIDAANPNNAAYALQELRRLLEKANAYWTADWQSTPVYLVAKAKCETETRYCLIVKGRLANDQNYYQQPFTGKRSTMQDLPLVIERRAWLETAPGTRTAVPISNEVVYDGRTLGRAATTADEVFHANKRTVANITNIHITTAGANLMDAALPYTIIDVSGTNSTYFGIDTSVSDSGPFDSLIFDIGTAQVGASITWEYWNGSSWASFSVLLRDDTVEFTNTGVNSVVWRQPGDWVAASPGGALPVGYYVRARVTATGSTNATQQNRLIYSQTVPYVEIAARQVPGDIPALTQMTVSNMLQRAGVSTVNLSRIIFGLRSNLRGVSSFTPYINFSDDQNPAGISVAGIVGALTTDSQYPTARVLRVTIGSATSANDQTVGIIELNSSVSDEFFGTYRAYARFGIATGFSSLEARIRIFDGSGTGLLFNSGYRDVPLNIDNPVTDLGQVPILPDSSRNNPGDLLPRIEINYTTTGATTLDLVDLILIPIDEWSIELIVPENLFANYIDANGLQMKRMIEALTRNSADERLGVVRTVNNGPIILQANTTQRLYSLAQQENSSDNFSARTGLVKRGQIWRNSRYLSLRGER